MKVKVVDINELDPYENNPRQNEAAIEHVAWSLKEYGWQQPIVVDKDNVIVAGHTRWLAAQTLGMEKVPVTIADSLTPEQVRGFRLADNKLHELSKWDKDLLSVELAALDMANVDLEAMGFSQDELNKLVNGEDPANEKDIEIEPLWQVIISCDSDAQQEEIYNQCQEHGWECKVVSL